MHGIQRVIFLDPTPFYDRAAYLLDPFARQQKSLDFKVLWPKSTQVCSCGCGKQLPERRTRWATDSCNAYANQVDRIIRGDLAVVRRYLDLYYGKACAHCKRSDRQIYDEEIRHLPAHHHRRKINTLSVDHIIPVSQGGGGSWLSNFQFLCHNCHVIKTRQDNGQRVSLTT